VAMQALGGAWATEFGLGSAATIINRRMHVRSELTVRFSCLRRTVLYCIVTWGCCEV